ncbi:uncharacterized protein EDB91DRAFT_557961 [Suillus paluster]|uniref:uncharacterized protein n=1 Tax=Suillus paluster TaxID=48578 RepID=UPI001B871113|nr:uncharacterized protein EDB91DRAFT_557961 [Suillus paluster]KAG1735643.1 hypothetical protein EDB91DRAFT_557961 [Suillus paluster]
MFHHQLGGLALMILGAPSHRIESRFIAAARIRAQHHDDLSHYLAHTLYPGLPLRVHHSIVHVNLGSPPGPLLLNPVNFVHTPFPTSVIQLVSRPSLDRTSTRSGFVLPPEPIPHPLLSASIVPPSLGVPYRSLLLQQCTIMFGFYGSQSNRGIALK